MSEALRVKKPKSNFLLFCEDQRAELKVSRPELKSTEIVQECSRLWKELSEEKKDVYNKKYQALKDSLPKVEKPEKPKSNRPKSAYINFCTLERARIRALHDGLGPKELMKKIAEEWALLSLEQKDKFKTEALEQARKEEEEKKKVQEKKDEEKKSVSKKKSSK
jgi:hypothetical protein